MAVCGPTYQCHDAPLPSAVAVSRVWVRAVLPALFSLQASFFSSVKMLGPASQVLERLSAVMVYVPHLKAWPSTRCLTKSFSLVLIPSSPCRVRFSAQSSEVLDNVHILPNLEAIRPWLRRQDT